MAFVRVQRETEFLVCCPGGGGGGCCNFRPQQDCGGRRPQRGAGGYQDIFQCFAIIFNSAIHLKISGIHTWSQKKLYTRHSKKNIFGFGLLANNGQDLCRGAIGVGYLNKQPPTGAPPVMLRAALSSASPQCTQQFGAGAACPAGALPRPSVGRLGGSPSLPATMLHMFTRCGACANMAVLHVGTKGKPLPFHFNQAIAEGPRRVGSEGVFVAICPV